MVVLDGFGATARGFEGSGGGASPRAEGSQDGVVVPVVVAEKQD